MGSSQARVLEWAATSSPGDLSDPGLQETIYLLSSIVNNGYDFSSSHVQMWELDHKESWASKMMLLNYGAGEDSWESLGQQGDQTSQS